MFAEDEEFTRLWTKAQPAVAGFIRAAVGNRAESDDLLQDVAVVLLRKFQTYDRSQAFVGWAIGIARYEILAYHRRCSSDRLFFDNETLGQVAAAYERVSNDLGDMGEALKHCVEGTTGRSRQLLELRYVDELSVNDIARRLRLGLSAVKVALHRLRVALHKCVEERLSRGGPR